MSKLSPRELEREAKIIARRLVRQKAWFENLAGKYDGAEKWTIISAKSTKKSALKPTCSRLVEGMTKAGWLVRDPGGALRLGAAGVEYLLKNTSNERFVDQHQIRQSRMIKNDRGLCVPVMLNETENPLGWMRARKDKSGQPLLSEVQFEAGEKIRKDFTLSQMSPRVTASWEFSAPSGHRRSARGEGAMETSERAMAAKQRLFAALDFLGPEMSSVVFEVCCMASGLEAAERQLRWPRRSAKLVLQIALGKLSQHYGMVQTDPGSGRASLVRKWARKGYRPEIPPADTP